MNTDMHHNRNRVRRQFDKLVRALGSSQKATVFRLNTLRLPDDPVNFPLTSHKSPLLRVLGPFFEQTGQDIQSNVPTGGETGGSGLR